MRWITPRPILLGLTLMLVISAIAAIELRLDVPDAAGLQPKADIQPKGVQRETVADYAFVVVALPQLRARGGSDVVDKSGRYGFERSHQTAQRFALSRYDTRIVQTAGRLIHGIFIGGGS